MSEFKQELINTVNKFRLANVEPLMEHDDQTGTFRLDIFKQLGELGLTGITTSDEFDGTGLGYQELSAVLEELAKSSVSYAVTVSVSSMVQGILQEFGTPPQKKKYLPSLAQGQSIGAFCLSESSAGSDAGALKTTAKKTQGGYILNGTKMWITSGGIAGVYIIMARTSDDGARGVTSFIVPNATEGLSFGKKENKMGWTISPTREVVLNNCFIPESQVLGQVGEGFKIAMRALDRGRITIGAIAVGLAQRALDESVLYSLSREQFNQPIFEFQGLQWMMADMALEVEASRLLVYQAAKLFDNKTPDVKLASMAKLKATDTAMYVTTEAVQIHGGVGYTKEFPVERLMRDAKVLQIVEGTNQVQKIVIARQLKKEYTR